MHSLYPPIKPHKTYKLPVTAPHVLYLEETGNPQGQPIIVMASTFSSGGEILRRFFDPEIYRIIIFDQRGCGRSTPHAELTNNTTKDMLDDIDHIRSHLQISRFILFAGGWNSLFALLYAQRYPQQIAALLLHQVFLARKKEIVWFYQKGTNLIFPDYWEDLHSIVPEKEKNNLISYYTNVLQGTNEVACMSAAKHWSLWQARCSSFHPDPNLIEQYNQPHFALGLAKIESHYLKHNYFIEENQVLNNLNKIRHIPSYLIHGRYNMICPLTNAWDLQQHLPSTLLHIVRDGGHSDQEIGIIDAIITTSNEIARQNLNVG